MVVYVLENGVYSDTHVVGIYSSRDAAELAARIFKDDASIEEWEIDASVEEMRRGCVPYFVRLKRDTGDVLECGEHGTSYSVGSSHVTEDVNKNLYTICWAVGREDAVKVAGDRRRMFLALAAK